MGKVLDLRGGMDRKMQQASTGWGGGARFSPTNAPDEEKKRPGDIEMWVEAKDVEDNPYQPRQGYNDEAIADIVASMDTQGQLMPAGVREKPGFPGKLQFIWGHNRKYAIIQGATIWDEAVGDTRHVKPNAGIYKENPSEYVGKIWVVLRKADELQMRKMAYSENRARLNISAMENAIFYAGTRQAMADRDGVPVDKISFRKLARFLGERTHHYIMRVIQLNDLPKYITDEFLPKKDTKPKEGEQPQIEPYTERQGRALLMLNDFAEPQRLLFNYMKKYNVSGNALEVIARKTRDQLKAGGTPVLPFDEEKGDANGKAGANGADGGKAGGQGAPHLKKIAGGQSSAPADSHTDSATDDPTETKTASDVADVPKLPEQVYCQLSTAETSLEEAKKGIEVLKIAPGDHRYYEEVANNAMLLARAIRRELKKQKPEGDTSQLPSTLPAKLLQHESEKREKVRKRRNIAI